MFFVKEILPNLLIASETELSMEPLAAPITNKAAALISSETREKWKETKPFLISETKIVKNKKIIKTRLPVLP